MGKEITRPITRPVQKAYDKIEDETKRVVRNTKKQAEEAIGFELEVGKEDIFLPYYNIGKNAATSAGKAVFKEVSEVIGGIIDKPQDSVEAAKLTEGGNNVVDPTPDNITDEVSKDTQLANEAMVKRSRSSSSVGGSRTANLLAGEDNDLEDDETSVRTLLGV